MKNRMKREWVTCVNGYVILTPQKHCSPASVDAVEDQKPSVVYKEVLVVILIFVVVQTWQLDCNDRSRGCWIV